MKNRKVETIPLTGDFKKLIGSPECRGSWFLMGDSGMGKSTFLMQLAKELTKYHKVDYNALEEEDRGSMGELMAENRMTECRKGSFMLLTGWPIEDHVERLRQKRSARIVIFDSVQYLKMTISDYKALLAEFHNKLFIFNSHAEGRQPVGALAKKIRFDADVKLFAEGFKVTGRSRMSRGKLPDDYIVWQEGADKYWNKI
ncbi:ATP-binding protein [Allomuricauda sp. M10]|uniref:ATP-binding protein n=1 Tax=Allomuricauda sp. M10 TaxID=2683292 RepID=UPI001D18C581|nr:ATP-binding protein [Muricauda sp. M10]